jgi:hypothetical protein
MIVALAATTLVGLAYSSFRSVQGITSRSSSRHMAQWQLFAAGGVTTTEGAAARWASRRLTGVLRCAIGAGSAPPAT